MGLSLFLGGVAALAIRLYNRLKRRDTVRLEEITTSLRQAARVVTGLAGLVETLLNALGMVITPRPIQSQPIRPPLRGIAAAQADVDFS